MGRNRVRPATKIAVCCAAVFASVVVGQSPGLGRLVIASNPSGARITVNGKAMQQATDATFVVGPGKYAVTVNGGPGNLNCPAKEITITPGQDSRMTCTKAGWAE